MYVLRSNLKLLEYRKAMCCNVIIVPSFFISVVDRLCLPRKSDNELLLLTPSGAWTTKTTLPARLLQINTNS